MLQVEVLDRLRFRAARPQDGRAPIRPRFHRQPEPRPRRDASCLDYFNAHSRSSRAYLPKDTLVLCANNRIADSINRENVDALDAPKVEFTAAVTGMVNSGDKMAPERIVLCRAPA